MKLFALVAAGLVAAAALAPVSSASAMPRHRWHTRTVCRTYWHHHHRVRRCRTVRVRRW